MTLLQSMIYRGIPFVEIELDHEEKPGDYGWYSLEFNIDRLSHYCIPQDRIDEWKSLPALTP